MALDVQLAALAAAVGADIKAIGSKPITIVGPSDDTPDPTKLYVKMTDAPSGTAGNLWFGTQAAYDGLGTYDPGTAYIIEG